MILKKMNFSFLYSPWRPSRKAKPLAVKRLNPVASNLIVSNLTSEWDAIKKNAVFGRFWAILVTVSVVEVQ
jgi:hypothetical protein